MCSLLPASMCVDGRHSQVTALLPALLRQECELARVDCLVSPLYRKRKLMNMTEAKELLGMCINECKRQALETAKQAVRGCRVDSLGLRSRTRAQYCMHCSRACVAVQ